MKLVLASTSPRRIQLMKQVGLSVKIAHPDADETPRSRERPSALVRRLSRAKAISVANGLRGDCLVIAADTIVVSPDGRGILGKPKHASEARSMLRLLSGRTHTVFTGYCVLHVQDGRKRKSLIRVVRSKVHLRALTAGEIVKYVATGEPMDKAGSYAAQGLGMALVERISGSYTNVVGLPMSQLLRDLETFGIPLFGKSNR